MTKCHVYYCYTYNHHRITVRHICPPNPPPYLPLRRLRRLCGTVSHRTPPGKKILDPPLCSASAMFVQCHIDDFNTLRRKYIYRFNCRIQNCDNSLVNNIFKWREFVLVPSVKEFYSCLYIGKRSQFVLLK